MKTTSLTLRAGYTPETSDLIAVWLLNSRSKAWLVSNTMRAATVGAIAIIATAAAIGPFPPLLGGAFILAAAAAWLAPFLLHRAIAQAAYQRAVKQGLIVPQTVTLDDDAIRFSSPNGESEILWRDVARLVWTPSHLFIASKKASRTYYSVPARAFHDESAFDAFRQRASDMRRTGRQ